jgi:hypothetical protein
MESQANNHLVVLQVVDSGRSSLALTEAVEVSDKLTLQVIQVVDSRVYFKIKFSLVNLNLNNSNKTLTTNREEEAAVAEIIEGMTEEVVEEVEILVKVENKTLLLLNNRIN